LYKGPKNRIGSKLRWGTIPIGEVGGVLRDDEYFLMWGNRVPKGGGGFAREILNPKKEEKQGGTKG